MEDSVVGILMQARLGDVEAQYDLGRFYYNGSGIEQDYYEAVQWWEKAAAQGNVDAMTYLADCYRLGRGADVDEDKCVEWLEKASELGYGKALVKLGDVFYSGLYGRKRDLLKAKRCYEQAYAQGKTWVKEKLKDINFQLGFSDDER